MLWIISVELVRAVLIVTVKIRSEEMLEDCH
jgi:hypothetical protein